MLEKIMIALPSEAKQALIKLARKEMRHYRSQAALIIREELIRRGFLAQDSPVDLNLGKGN